MRVASNTATVPAKRPQTAWRRVLLALALVAAVGLVAWIFWSRSRGEALWRTARIAARQGDWARAEGALASLAWYRPGDAEARRLHIQVALKRGDLETAGRLLAQAARAGPGAAEARVGLGRIRLEQYRLAEAEDAYRDCLALDPRNREAWHALVVILGVERRGAEQEAELLAIVERGGAPALEALRLLAPGTAVIPAEGLSRTSDEGQILERALAANPADPHVRAPLADFYRVRGRVSEARQLLEPWMRTHRDDQSARDAWLACMVDDGDPATELKFRRLTPGDQASGHYFSIRADWLSQAGRHDEALQCLQLALERTPRDPGIIYRMGQALRALGRNAEANGALDLVQKARELSELASRIPDAPSEAAPLVSAGKLCRALGREPEARGWFSEALRIDPNCWDAREALRALAGTSSQSGARPMRGSANN